ncbi:1065_t:CDS:2, partial [Paraglomus brasilianum]
AFPLVLLISILAIGFATMQLWKESDTTSDGATNQHENTSFEGTSAMSEGADFPSTREAIETILPQASEQEIAMYEKQIDNAEIFDPILVISANHAWINQHGLPAYYAVMDAFATNGLNNKRRDEGSRFVFHFAGSGELYTVRDSIHNLFPNAFFYPPSVQAMIPTTPRTQPIGIAWIIIKMGTRKNDFAKDGNFFYAD